MRWVAVAIWMGVIFFFSSQPGGESAGLSAIFVDALSGALPAVDVDTLGIIVRKGAHVTEYAVLGLLLAWALRGRYAWAVLIGVAYAVTDETHQLFVPGRGGQVTDVLIDSVGVLIGVGAFAFVSSRRAARPGRARAG